MSSNGESSEDVSFPRRIGGGPSPEFGIPRECFCGRNVLLKTSRTTANPGRLYFTCRNSEDGARHLWKWLDEAMLEHFKIVNLRLDEADRSYELVLKRLGCGQAAMVDPSGRIFTEELNEIKEGIAVTEQDIADLKNAIQKQNSGTKVAAKFIFMAGVGMICLSLLNLFK